jgi:hypothetical protein
MTPTGVNLSDGTYTFTDVDLAIGGLKLERFYLGAERDANDPFFGPRVSHNFDIYVSAANRSICNFGSPCLTYKRPVVHMGTSAANFYRSGSFIAPSNDDNNAGTLTLSGSAYVYTNKDGDVYTFSTSVAANGATTSQRVDNIQFANGRRQDFLYSGNYLKVVKDSSGYAIVFEYNGSNLVSKACGYNMAVTYVSSSSTCTGSPLVVSYGYTSTTLTTVTDVASGVTTYDYSSGICIKPPGYSSCKITTTFSSGTPYPWRVVQQTLAGGAVWNYSYAGDSSKARNPEQFVDTEPTWTATVTDPDSKVSTYSFVVNSPYSFTDANNKTTEYRFLGGCFDQFDYDENAVDCSTTHYGSQLVEATFPEGNKYQAQYNSVRRMLTDEKLIAKAGSGLADITTSTNYPSDCTTSPNTPQNCAKPVWSRDAKANQTDYTHNSWGGITSEMQPAPSTNAARPLKLYAYVQKYSYVKNSGGTLVASATPIWLPDTETACQTVTGSSPAAACDTGAPITVTSYEYGANGVADNLLLRGKVITSGGVSLRTCYGYDALGRKIWETSPRGTTSSVCQ